MSRLNVAGTRWHAVANYRPSIANYRHRSHAAEGHDVDLITLDADPLADITILANPAHVAGVWKAGRRVKAPHSNMTEHR